MAEVENSFLFTSAQVWGFAANHLKEEFVRSGYKSVTS